MNVIDYSVFGVVLLSALMGLVRGFTREILSLISWTGAIVSTLMFWPLVQHIARQFIEHPMLADGATILALFILFLILFSLISYFLSNIVRNSALGGIDRSLGSLFGVFRGMALICLIELFLSCFVSRVNQPDILKDSKFSEHIYKGSDVIFTILPDSLQHFIRQQQAKYADSANSPSKTFKEATAAAIIEHAQDTVDEMASLKPKTQKGDPNSPENKANYSKKQRQDMERLLLQGGEPQD
jgi:membrane protein required for colicin V production